MIFTKTFFSPFKPLKWKFHFGGVKIGVPYFTPRVWKKATPKKAKEEALREIERIKEHKSKEGSYKRTERSFEELYESYLKYKFPRSKKIGTDLRDVGWKTKWSNTDYRFEYAPVFSFVFFGLQFAIVFIAPEQHHYWEAFLYYHFNTDKLKSAEERVEQCRKEAPQTWKRHYQSKTETIDYYELILRKNFLKENLDILS